VEEAAFQRIASLARLRRMSRRLLHVDSWEELLATH
jgi:hypothetical protein